MLKFLIGLIAGCVLVFLFVCRFFDGWDGQVVSVRPPRTPDPAVYQVLIVNAQGDGFEANWPSELIDGLDLPFDPLAIPPSEIPSERPRTIKTRYRLHFLLEDEDAKGGYQVIPTTSPQGIGVVLLLFFLTLAIRNMAYAGSPVRITKSPMYLPKRQASAGQAAGSAGGGRGRKGPPPSRPRRGTRR